MADFNLTTTTLQGAIIIKIAGQLHVHTEGLEHQLDLIVVSRPKRVILDLSELTFISSLGLGAFVSLNRTLHRHNGTLALTGITPALEGGFRFTRISDLIPTYPTLAQALAAPNPTPK